jgi:hypothetical protein
VLAAFGGRQPVGDGLLTPFHRPHQRRPHKFHREPDEQRKADHLAD